MPNPSAPLSHIRVLDLSRVLAGPWASQLLADLGADVIKVERPGNGDDTRAWGPPFLETPSGPGDAGYYLTANRGKRSITLDLDKSEAQDLVRRLAAQSDVVLENFKVGTLARFGLDYPSLSRVNPRLVYCSITGFGQSGPRAAAPAYDFLIQAMGGLMSITGEPAEEPGGTPQKVGVPIVDLVTGVYAAVGALAAIAQRERTGRGDHIDLGMLDVQVSLLANQAMNYLMSGRTPQRTGTAHPNIQPQRVFACQDGDMVLVVGNDGQFARLCAAIGQPGLAADARYATNGARVRNQASLTALLTAVFVRETRAHWEAVLGTAGVPCGPINSVPEVFAEAQVRHRGMLRHLPHALAGEVPQVASPLRFTESDGIARRGPPLIGEHTDEVLQELGETPERIARLRAAHII
ncbi:CoA transferase [Verticiella sediminum]|uniref:CoA transferase n=1 Tax=Verticiella sediminum TaxID=1247510 RepID=A0A556APN1_9BURK|nr:CaiB/BaiF CoA-transferase family protein [Verticiella sediminum]TSH94852.1 CoA transferase [Verticiella sediminum]